MSVFTFPLGGFPNNRINQTLHGRSVHRPVDVPGHNVFKGYLTWAQTGRAVGDALDSFAPAGTPITAICDGTITHWDNDTEKLEVIYLAAPGVVAVYAHIDYLPRPEIVPRQVTMGEPIGAIRSDLNDPHVHFELWIEGKALSASTPTALRDLMVATLQPAASPDEPSPWAREAAAWAMANGLTDGTRPHDPQTREESWLQAYRLRNLIRNADSP